ncbi:hypothetical protein BS78_K331500 [Paspalum vaginatum]|uniref:F-box domain-containing protein n=1 Tax=Paspalum vaginatum TaxID=158149 RepID=A0A9W7XAG5_9POAL|nr:hypothetical protein BS78_K331500 [Paspalum vaginatum]
MEEPPRELPDDVLQEEVLGRLPPRALATCRCVCKAWRAAIDERRTLRPDLLLLSPCGIFVTVVDEFAAPHSKFFGPPTAGRVVASKLESYVEPGSANWEWLGMWISRCCNGLLLLKDELVVNPATRRWARLPPCPVRLFYDFDQCHLPFDPSLSPYYHVLVIQNPDDYEQAGEPLDAGSEWPPSPHLMWVYSSATGRWEKRSFAREGGPAGTLAEVMWVNSDEEPHYREAVYYHGAFYVYAACKTDFIMRVTISDCKYQVIELLDGANDTVNYHEYKHLLKSKDRVYLAFIHKKVGQLRVWSLDESSGKAVWVLKYDVNLKALDSHFTENRYPKDMPWIILRGDDYDNDGDDRRANAKNSFEWDFDNGNMVKINDTKEERWSVKHDMDIVGFHPYREVAFLHLGSGRVVAYHLDSSKVQDLGHFHVPHRYYVGRVYEFFVYCPCRMGELS